MATTVVNPGVKDVQWLSDHARGEGMIVSCYADMSVSSGVRPPWREHLKNAAKRIEETLTGGPEARAELHRNIAAIESALSRRPVSAHGMAVFAGRDLLQAYALASAVPNRLVVDEEPYLLPLLEMLRRQYRYLAVHTSTHRGRLYAAVPGAVRLIEEVAAPVAKRHRASGELWGKQQATIARHHEDQVLHYVKELAREIERAWPEEAYDGIMLFGEHDLLQQLRTHLPDELSSSIAGEAPHAWVGRQVPLVAKVASIHEQALRRQERQLFEDVTRRATEQHRIATGAQAVIDAIDDDEIGYSGCVVMTGDTGEVASRCWGCGKVYAQAIDECPMCHARCEKTNLAQAIALSAARKHITTRFVSAALGLEQYGGVVALLERAPAATGVPVPELTPALELDRA